MERRQFEDYIMKEYFIPYFLSGVKKYIEGGDIIPVEDLEFFILNLRPENGFITNDTNVIFKLGLSKERCLEKINNADNRLVMSLIDNEDISFSSDIPNGINLANTFNRMYLGNSDARFTRTFEGYVSRLTEIGLFSIIKCLLFKTLVN
jgi:hypothetical protein